MLRTLVLIDSCGVYAYLPDGFSAPGLPMVVILNDIGLTPLPVRDVRGLLTRSLVMEVWDREDPIGLVLSDAGRRLLTTDSDSLRGVRGG